MADGLSSPPTTLKRYLNFVDTHFADWLDVGVQNSTVWGVGLSQDHKG
jgi:hypothetical protein